MVVLFDNLIMHLSLSLSFYFDDRRFEHRFFSHFAAAQAVVLISHTLLLLSAVSAWAFLFLFRSFCDGSLLVVVSLR